VAHESANVQAEAAVSDVAAKTRDKGLGEVLYVAFAQTRPRNTRAVRPHFNQSEIARKRRLKLKRAASRLDREAQVQRNAEQALLRLTEHARTVGRPLDELLIARGDERRVLDKVIAQLVLRYGRKPLLLATNYRAEQLTRSYKRGLV